MIECLTEKNSKPVASADHSGTCQSAWHIRVPFCYTLVKSKGFPSFRIGKKWIIATDKLMDWIDLQTSSDENKNIRKVQ